MRRSVWAIVTGLVIAILGAAALAKIAGLPFAPLDAGERPIWHLMRTAMPIAAFILPGALTAILLAEARRVRGLAFWMFAGALLAAIGYLTLTAVPGDLQTAFKSPRTFAALMGTGLFSGWLYWLLAGRHAGNFATALERAGQADLDENGLRRRCRACSAMALVLGLVPLAVAGWHMNYKSPLSSPLVLVAQAETHGTQQLADAGYPWAKLSIENHVGRVTGTAPDAAARAAGFEKAKQVLAPMVGLPGVVAYLQNDIASPDALAASAQGVPVEKVAPEVPAVKKSEDLRLAADAQRKADEAAAKARLKAEEAVRLEAEAKRKADQAAAKAKAAEESRVAIETKRKAEEAAAKAKADEAAAKARAEEELRLAAEAKRKADEATAKAKAKALEELRAEEARAAEEAKRKADEAAAKARALEEVRREAEAKRKADEEAAAKALELQRVDDEKRLAEDLAAQRKADEQKRLELEAQAERAAVEAARKADAAKATATAAATAPAPPPVTPAPSLVPVAPSASPLAAPDLNCDGDFSDAFRQATVKFAFKSARLDQAALQSLDRIGAVAKRCGSYSLAIGGHSDRTGVAAFNQAMSLQRALAVREALVARGIEVHRLKAEGYGAQRPFDPANTRAAYRLNRRVDFGAALTPAPLAPPKELGAPPAPAAAIAALAPEQCNSEFSRVLQSDTIRFTGSSAIVADTYADFLDTLAGLALSCPAHTIAIGGHTDRRGRAAFNQTLSQERAQAVRDALIDRDVPEARVTATGYAGERPFDPANTKAAYRLNRRVDFGVAIRPSKSQ